MYAHTTTTTVFLCERRENANKSRASSSLHSALCYSYTKQQIDRNNKEEEEERHAEKKGLVDSLGSLFSLSTEKKKKKKKKRNEPNVIKRRRTPWAIFLLQLALLLFPSFSLSLSLSLCLSLSWSIYLYTLYCWKDCEWGFKQRKTSKKKGFWKRGKDA